jgi:hypothetical protein
MNGVIEVHFKPEAEQLNTLSTDSLGACRGGGGFRGGGEGGPPRGGVKFGASGVSSGATALGRTSTQQFNSVDAIENVDKERETRLAIRLVCIDKPVYEAVAGTHATTTIPMRVD